MTGVASRQSANAAAEYERNPNSSGAAFNMHHCKPNLNLRFNWFSNLTADEALVFIQYDSAPNDSAVFRPTLHTACNIPGSEGLHQRESVEVRLLIMLPIDRAPHETPKIIRDVDSSAKL